MKRILKTVSVVITLGTFFTGCITGEDDPSGQDDADVGQSNADTGNLTADANIEETDLSTEIPTEWAHCAHNDRPHVTFQLNYMSDVPESVYVQSGNSEGIQEWLTISPRGGETFERLEDGCSSGLCVDMARGLAHVCAASRDQVTRFVDKDLSGSIEYDWDGQYRTTEDWNQCRCVRDAEPGEYTATFCLGWVVEGELESEHRHYGVVTSPTCHSIDFTYPVESGEVVWDFDNGG